MRQTSLVIAPIVGIASVPSISLPLDALNVGDLSRVHDIPRQWPP